MNAHAAIHTGCKHLGLDEDARRDLYARVTGKRSLREMSADEQESVVAELRRQGFKVVSMARQQAFKGRYVPMMQALWLDGYHLGLVRNPTDAALIAFVKRQTRIDHMRWVNDAADARRVIEALKGWMARDAGVVWNPRFDDGRSRQLAVIDAQLRILGLQPGRVDFDGSLVSEMKRLGGLIRKRKR